MASSVHATRLGSLIRVPSAKLRSTYLSICLAHMTRCFSSRALSLWSDSEAISGNGHAKLGGLDADDEAGGYGAGPATYASFALTLRAPDGCPWG